MIDLKRTVAAVALSGLLGLGAIGSANAVSVQSVNLDGTAPVGTTVADVLTLNPATVLPADDGDDNPVAPAGTFPVNADLGSIGDPRGFSVLYQDVPTPPITFPNGPFNNAFTFDVGDTFNIAIDIGIINDTGFPARFENMTLTLFDVTGLGITAGSDIGGLSGAFAQLQLTPTASPFVQLVDQVILTVTPNVTEILGVFSGTAVAPPGGQTANYNATVSAVPLPAPVVLLISALVGLGFLGRRKVRV